MWCGVTSAFTAVLTLCAGIHSLGSPQWGEEGGLDPHRSGYDPSLCRFLYALRTLMRTSYSVCMLTVPTHLFQVMPLYLRNTWVGCPVIVAGFQHLCSAMPCCRMQHSVPGCDISLIQWSIWSHLLAVTKRKTPSSRNIMVRKLHRATFFFLFTARVTHLHFCVAFLIFNCNISMHEESVNSARGHTTVTSCQGGTCIIRLIDFWCCTVD